MNMDEQLRGLYLAENEDYYTVKYRSREDWLIGRSRNPICGQQTLGGSDAGVVMGVSTFKTPQELYSERRVGVKSNTGENERMRRGHDAEPHIRALFAIEHPEYQVDDGTDLVFYSKKYPWASCSLDSILHDGTSFGVHEIKSVQWSVKWKGEFAPDAYFLQVVHNMMVTGWAFGILHARICGRFTRDRLYYYPREQILEQGEALMEEERRFLEAVETGSPIPYKIPML